MFCVRRAAFVFGTLAKEVAYAFRDERIQYPNERGDKDCPQGGEDRVCRPFNDYGQSRHRLTEERGDSADDGLADQVEQEPRNEERQAPGAVELASAGCWAFVRVIDLHFGDGLFFLH